MRVASHRVTQARSIIGLIAATSACNLPAVPPWNAPDGGEAAGAGGTATTPNGSTGGSNGGSTGGTSSGPPSPTTVAPEPIRSMSLGPTVGCAILAKTGSVWCWGDNSYGQLGTGQAGPASMQPVAVAGMTAVDNISVAAHHVCARKNNQLVCWGDLTQLGGGAIRPPTTLPVPGAGVSAVTAGEERICVVSYDSNYTPSIYCWGQIVQNTTNGAAWLGSTSPVLVGQPYTFDASSDEVFITAGLNCSIGYSGGMILCWGADPDNLLELATPPAGGFVTTPASAPWYGMSAPVGGRNFFCRAASVGITCWGAVGGVTGANGMVAGSANQIQVTAGDHHGCSIGMSGAVGCFGAWNSTVSKTDGAALMTFTPVPGLGSNVTALAAGGNHTCAFNGTSVSCWSSLANDTGWALTPTELLW